MVVRASAHKRCRGRDGDKAAHFLTAVAPPLAGRAAASVAAIVQPNEEYAVFASGSSECDGYSGHTTSKHEQRSRPLPYPLSGVVFPLLGRLDAVLLPLGSFHTLKAS